MTRITLLIVCSLALLCVLKPQESFSEELTERGPGLFIDFEDYPVGVPPGDPWGYGPGVDFATISGPAYSGQNALGLVSNYSFTNTRLTYPISITEENGNVVISVKVRPPHYVPGNWDSGFVTLAGFLIMVNQGDYNPGVIFDMNKQHGSPLQPSHYRIRTKSFFSGIGTFLPGQYHDITTTFDWDAGVAQTVITRPDGISYTESWTIDFTELQHLAFSGGASFLPQSARLAMFDDVSVSVEGGGIQDHEILENLMVAGGEQVCFDALHTIISTDFTVEAGGSATLIAGQSIRLLPGTTVEQGGYFLARIAAHEDDYCGIPRAIDVAKVPDTPLEDAVLADYSFEISKNGFFKVYPNPTNGDFTLELTTAELEQSITVEIHSMLGGRLLSKELPPQRLHALSLEGQQPGMYIIRVMKGDKVGFQRLIKR